MATIAENKALFDLVRAVPADCCKPFNNGSFSGTDIKPMWRIEKLTEMFGVCGFGWYYEVLSERSEPQADGSVIAIVDLNLYVKMGGEWSKPIFGTGGNKIVNIGKNGARVSDEGYKMALTDALSVACKALGMGADIYYGREPTKYTYQDAQDAPRAAKKPVQAFEPQGAATGAVDGVSGGLASVKQRQYILRAVGVNELAGLKASYGDSLEKLGKQEASRIIGGITAQGA